MTCFGRTQSYKALVQASPKRTTAPLSDAQGAGDVIEVKRGVFGAPGLERYASEPTGCEQMAIEYCKTCAVVHRDRGQRAHTAWTRATARILISRSMLQYILQ